MTVWGTARARRAAAWVVAWTAVTLVAVMLVVAGSGAPSDGDHAADHRHLDGHGGHGGHGGHDAHTSETGHDMAGMVQPSPAAYVADDQPLDPQGWTASEVTDAGAEGTAFAAAPAVVDDDPGTVWRAADDGAATLVVDLGGPRAVSSLTYLAPEGARGAITRYEIETSPDGETWSRVAYGRWRADGTTMPAELAPRAVRFVRLTALDTADDAPAAVAEVVLGARLASDEDAGGVGEGSSAPGGPRAPGAGPPSRAGSWGPVIGFPLVPVAAALLPGNRLLTWSAYATDNYEPQGEGRTQTAVLDLDTGEVRSREVSRTGHDMFCPGVVMLADGRLMVTGGSNATETSIYDPATDRWSADAPMNIGRGYHAMTLMPDGRAFTVGGSWGDEAGLDTEKQGEIWSEDDGWTLLDGVSPDPMLTDDAAGIFRQDNHMWLFPTGRDELVQLGPSRAMNRISVRGRGSVTTVEQRPGIDQMNGNAVMYDRDRVLVLGGAANYDQSPSTGSTFSVDISGDVPVVRRSGDLREPRSFANSVVLPTGEVVAIGGQSVPLPFSDQDSSYRPEIWDPTSGRWRLGAPMAEPRNYHSVAVLLPDGRVFSGGGGLCGDCETNHFNGQIYTPGYLLRPDGSRRPRPRITRWSRRAPVGGRVVVRTDRPVTSFALVRAAEATHSVDNDQRRVPLKVLRKDVGRRGARYVLRVPPDPSVALPGNYLLFAMTGNGTPSVSRPVNVPVP